MDCRTGELKKMSSKDWDKLREEGRLDGLAPIEEKDVKKVASMPIPKRKNWMRNKPCPCGSKKKFKKCCWGKFTDKLVRAMPER